MTLLAILPLTAFLVGFAAFGLPLGRGSIRLGLLRTAVIWGVVAVLSAEILSLFSAVSQISLTALWAGLTAGGLLLFFSRRAWRQWAIHLASFKVSQTRFAWPFKVGCGAIVVLTGIVAWHSPPLTWDSLHYHLPRVAQWAQLGGLRHFPTGIEIQNSMPPAAEVFALHAYLLAGGDQWVNFVGWLAIFGTAIGVSLIARLLGAGRWGELTAAVFFLTLPMAVIQASSTATDSVVSLWMACVAVEALDRRRSAKVAATEHGFIGAAAGLAVLTKPTAAAFLLPLGLFVLYDEFREGLRRRLLRGTFVVVLVVTILNAGHWWRNYVTYRNPVAPSARIAKHRANWLGGRGLVSNVTRNAALHAGTPSPHVNKGIALAIQELHNLMGIDVNDPRNTTTGRFKVSAPTTNEDKAGNSLHAYLLLSFIVFLFVKRRDVPGLIRAYGLATLLTFVLFSALFKWQAFGSRYHLPFFALAAPVVGWVVERFTGRGWRNVILASLLIASAPWLLQIKSRPLIAKEGTTYVGSIFTESRQSLYFANGAHLEEPYQSMADLITQAGCHRIGINISGSQAEYPLWVLLGAPDPALRMEWIVAGTASAEYRDSTFEACAVVCQGCGERANWGALELTYSRPPFGLFLEQE